MYSEATSLLYQASCSLAARMCITAFCVGASLITGLEYGMEVKLWNGGMEHGMVEWNMEWNSECTQL